MKAYVRGLIGPIAMLMILGLIAIGCTATPTPFVLTPESPTAPAQPQAPSLQGALTANQTNVQVLLGTDPAQVLQQFETVSIPEGGQITVDESGRGVMRFGDRHEVDLFGNTEVVIDDAKLESGGSTFVRVRQAFGHTRFSLNEQSVARVTVETGDATITTLEQGTEFAVCYAPEQLNCIAVQRGAVEITSQGQKQTYREGEATFFEPGQPPQPPFCIPQEEFDEWLIQKRSPDDPGPLSELVRSSPPGPCGAAASETATVDVSPSSPIDTPVSTIPATATLTLTATVPPGVLYARINAITIDENQRYIVEYETFEFTEQLPGMHVHFFFDTVPPEQAGVPGQGPWYLYGGPRPFTGYSISDRPEHAEQMCILVANADHSVHLNSGSCLDLPASP